ncbi:MAG: ParB/RepB/Spo0J family partition protein [Acidimicrobiales bacterium]
MNQRASGLGKGLGALIPEDTPAPAEAGTSGLADVSIDQVHPNRFQPRTQFDEASLDALAASIREVGVLQPILVRPDGDAFELIAGERRWRAAKRAGLGTVPALIRAVEDRTSLEEAVVENLHRQDLNALEEAAAYQQLIDEFDLTQERVAERVGKSRSTITNTLRLLSLPAPVQRMVLEDRLSAGHARALLSVNDESQLAALARQVVDDELSVRQTERLVRGEPTDTPPAPPPAAKASRGDAGGAKDPALLELESLLEERLATRVALTMGPKNGRIVIDFADLDDLERLYRLLTNP